MKIIRIIAMVMLAFLYLGGTYALLAGAAFPLLGTGNKAYSDSKGTGNDPVLPTISPRRHMPMVKQGVLSPLMAVDQQVFNRPDEFLIVPESKASPAVLVSPVLTCSSRGPPAL
jgi:hypothetical protein